MADEEDIPSLTLRLLRELHSKLDRAEHELRADITAFRTEVRAELDVIHEDVRGLRVRVQAMDTEMRAGFAAVTHVLASIDARVTHLEQ